MAQGWQEDRRGIPDFDTSVASPARIWNYWLGGKDNFAVDREAAEKVAEAMPLIPLGAQASRRFLIDAVHMLADEYGIRQFLDLGTGLPTASNTHEVAQRVAPESRVVYVDNDPVVIVHGEALLSSSAAGKTDYLQVDLRDTDTILAGAAETLDFSRPVAVLLIAVLHFIPDADDPYGLVTKLMNAVPSGSYLVIGHAARDTQAESAAQTATGRYNQRSSAPIKLRTHEEVTRFFDGLELNDPGVVSLSQWWRAGQADREATNALPGYCGIARKP